MKKVLFLFTDVAVLVGGVIGAGFASGEEISLYFHGKNALLSSVVVFFIFFAVFYVFLYVGRKISELDKADFRYKRIRLVAKVSRIFLNFNYFAVLCSMLAGANVTLSVLFDIKTVHFVFGAITAIVCGAILYFDMNGVRRFSDFVVPFIVLLIVVVSLLNFEYCNGYGSGGVGHSFMYVSMNCVIMSGVLLGMGENKKTNIFWLSFISSFVLAVLLYLIISCVNALGGTMTMPMLYYAYLVSLEMGALMSVVIYFSIVTTVIACAYPLVEWLTKLTKSKLVAIFTALGAALAASLVGFAGIINYIYPLISIIGVAIIIVYIGLLVYLKVTPQKK